MSEYVLEFRNICYDVVLKTGQDAGSSKRILHEVTATCSSGRLTALMGPSGAGKSSLVGFLLEASRLVEGLGRPAWQQDPHSWHGWRTAYSRSRTGAVIP